jgi:hypothetical protein
MSPPPGTRDEYSRGDGGSRGAIGAKNPTVALPLKGAATRGFRRSDPRPARRIRFNKPVRATVVAGAFASATVLVVAEFLTLYSVRVIRGSASVPPVAAGTENHYALIPIALLGLILALAAIRLGDRWALTAVAALGLIALLIGLLHDLPDARRTGLVGSLHTGWVRGASSPDLGMYLETLGAVMLVLTAGLGLLFGEPVVEDVPAEDKARVPFGVEPTPGAGVTPAVAVTQAPVAETVPVADEPSVLVDEVVPKPPAKRPPSAPRKRSTSSRPKRATGGATRSSSPAKRGPAGSRERPASSPSADGAGAAGGEATGPAPSTSAKRSGTPTGRSSSAKRSSKSSAKRSPSARKQATKKSPSNPKRGGSSTPRTSPRPKRSES